MKNYKYRQYLKNLFPCLLYGVFCGSLTGAAIFLFKLAAKKAEVLSRHFYGIAGSSLPFALLGFGVLIFFALVMAQLHKHLPEVKGGGIPRSEGILRGVLTFRPLKTLLGTFTGSILSFLGGLPLGSEGPAVLIGTSIGSLCSNVSGKKSAWSRYIMTGGAGAGFAVATGAPLSGILFAVEEIHKRFTPMLVLTVSMSVISATYVNQLLCSLFCISPDMFEVGTLTSFALSDTGYLLLLGFFTALAVGLFDISITLFRRATKKAAHIVSPTMKLLFFFVFTGILGLFFADAVYSGHDVVHMLMHENKTVLYLAVLFFLRLFLMVLVTDSGVTGGIFIPTLAIGALSSALIGKFLLFLGMPEELFVTVLLLGMCAFIGGTLRAPFTAAVLFLELTGQFTDLFFVALVIFLVSFLTELQNQMPFYDTALEEMEHAQNRDKEAHIGCFELKISPDSFAVGKAVRDILWPASCVVISITRDKNAVEDMDHDGEKRLYPGDTIVVRAKYHDENYLKETLYGLTGTHAVPVRMK